MRFLFAIMLLVLFALPASAQEEGEGLSVQVDREVERATDTSPEVPMVDDEAKVLLGDYEGVVTKVLDGDTIEIEGERVRLLGVNAPEYQGRHNDCYGLESTKKLEALILGKMVTYSFDRGYGERDKYGDQRVYLYFDGIFVNAWLIENGLAFVDPSKTYHMQEDLEPLQVLAKRKHFGLWHACPVECNRVGICRTRNW